MALKQTFLVLINLFQLMVPALCSNPLLKIIDVVLDLSIAFDKVCHEVFP